MTKIRILTLALLGLAGIGFSVGANPAPRLIWNATPSVPVGFYIVRPGTVEEGELAAAWLPEPTANLAHARGYLPRGVLALKVVFAVAGDEICRDGQVLLVNGKAVAVAHKLDRFGRKMPAWSGCRRLTDDEVFLLNAHPDSFDGRYIGAIPQENLVGRAHRLP